MRSLFGLIALLPALFLLAAPAAQAAPPEPEIIPLTATLSIDGELRKLDGYLIDGYHHFRLPDLAYLCQGTDKRFEIVWDENETVVNSAGGTEYVINLFSKQDYTPQGGELTVKAGPVAGLSQVDYRWRVQLQEPADFLTGGGTVTAYRINGENYFALRTVASLLDLGLNWNAAARVIELDCVEHYLNKVTVTNVEQLVAALRSNTIIKLGPGVYDFARFNAQYPQGFEIRGLQYLRIEEGPTTFCEVEFINSDPACDVLRLINCQNIDLSRIRIDRTRQEQIAGVNGLYIAQGERIMLEVALYGAGIYADNSYVLLRNTPIENCVFSALQAVNGSRLDIINSRINQNSSQGPLILLDNSTLDYALGDINSNSGVQGALLQVQNGATATLRLTYIRWNQRTAQAPTVLFETDANQSQVVLEDCEITDNHLAKEYQGVAPQYHNCTYEHNTFQE